MSPTEQFVVFFSAAVLVFGAMYLMGSRGGKGA